MHSALKAQNSCFVKGWIWPYTAVSVRTMGFVCVVYICIQNNKISRYKLFSTYVPSFVQMFARGLSFWNMFGRLCLGSTMLFVCNATPWHTGPNVYVFICVYRIHLDMSEFYNLKVTFLKNWCQQITFFMYPFERSSGTATGMLKINMSDPYFPWSYAGLIHIFNVYGKLSGTRHTGWWACKSIIYD